MGHFVWASPSLPEMCTSIFLLFSLSLPRYFLKLASELIRIAGVDNDYYMTLGFISWENPVSVGK